MHRIPEVHDPTHTQARCAKAHFSGVRIHSSSDSQGSDDPEEEREGDNSMVGKEVLWVALEVSGEALQRKYSTTCLAFYYFYLFKLIN